MVIVDTPVWSDYLRRNQPNPKLSDALDALIREGEAIIIGSVRQEILSGVKEPARFNRLRENLRDFDDEPTLTSDYEDAASMSNQCRALGIQGSNTDFLICAISARLGAPIFTLDQDFHVFAQALPIRLFPGA